MPGTAGRANRLITNVWSTLDLLIASCHVARTLGLVPTGGGIALLLHKRSSSPDGHAGGPSCQQLW